MQREYVVTTFADGACNAMLPWGVVEIRKGLEPLLLARLRSSLEAEAYRDWLQEKDLESTEKAR